MSSTIRLNILIQYFKGDVLIQFALKQIIIGVYILVLIWCFQFTPLSPKQKYIYYVGCNPKHEF